MTFFKNNALLIMSLAIIYLSSVLLFAVFEVRNVRNDLPDLMNQFETMDTKVDIAGIIGAVNGVSTQIPSIVTEIGETRQTLEQINKDMPALLAETAALRQTTIPAVIKESQAIRASTPDTLEKADKIVTKLSNVSENFTKNLATGTVKSVISAPSDVVKGVGKGLTGGLNKITGTKPAADAAK